MIILLIGLATAFSNPNSQLPISLKLDEIHCLGLAINAKLILSEGETQEIQLVGSNHHIYDIITDVINGKWKVNYNSHKVSLEKEAFNIKPI